jgi:hypothetical protein
MILCGISASGNVLMPGLSTKRDAGYPDANQCSFLLNAADAHWMPNMF